MKESFTIRDAWYNVIHASYQFDLICNKCGTKYRIFEGESTDCPCCTYTKGVFFNNMNLHIEYLTREID